MADIAKMLMEAINNYERTRKSNAQQNIQMNAQRSREFLANKGMKQRAAMFASRQDLAREIAQMREEGRDRRQKNKFDADIRVRSAKETSALKAKSNLPPKRMMFNEGDMAMVGASYDPLTRQPQGALISGTQQMKVPVEEALAKGKFGNVQPVFRKPKKTEKTESGGLEKLDEIIRKRSQIKTAQGNLKARGY